LPSMSIRGSAASSLIRRSSPVMQTFGDRT
jgi:hypothetical protein